MSHLDLVVARLVRVYDKKQQLCVVAVRRIYLHPGSTSAKVRPGKYRGVEEGKRVGRFCACGSERKSLCTPTWVGLARVSRARPLCASRVVGRAARQCAAASGCAHRRTAPATDRPRVPLPQAQAAGDSRNASCPGAGSSGDATVCTSRNTRTPRALDAPRVRGASSVVDDRQAHSGRHRHVRPSAEAADEDEGERRPVREGTGRH